MRLSLRMNQFGYGYEDEVIFTLPQLQQLDDIKIGAKQEKRKIIHLAQNVSNSIIPAFVNVNHIISSMVMVMEKISGSCSSFGVTFRNQKSPHPLLQNLEELIPL